LFTGKISGGGALLPPESSRTFIIDADHPINQGMPSDFLVGLRTAFAVTEYNGSWLQVSAEFTSSGFGELVPQGTYPAVLSGRCGSGRVVLFMMNHFQAIQLDPVTTMVRNAVRWALGENP